MAPKAVQRGQSPVEAVTIGALVMSTEVLPVTGWIRVVQAQERRRRTRDAGASCGCCSFWRDGEHVTSGLDWMLMREDGLGLGIPFLAL